MLDFVAVAASLCGMGLGLTKLAFRWSAFTALVGLALTGWVARATAIIYATDVANAEDYLNDLNVVTGTIEFAVILIWLTVCFGIGHAIRSFSRSSATR